jgi:hypothetical protein
MNTCNELRQAIADCLDKTQEGVESVDMHAIPEPGISDAYRDIGLKQDRLDRHEPHPADTTPCAAMLDLSVEMATDRRYGWENKA